MKTPQEAAREYAHDHIAERCKSTNCKEFDCRPFDRNVAGYHTRCRARYQEYRDGFLAGDAFGYRRGLEKAYRWISVMDELPDDDTLILTKDTDCHIDLIRGWQLKERIKPYAVQNFYTHWRPIERVKE